MDDLIPFVLALLRGDALFSGVTVCAPGGTVAATYPRVVVTGGDGVGQSQGDPGMASRTGTLRLETFCRDEADQTGLDRMWELASRAQFLVAGDRAGGDPGIAGTHLLSEDGRRKTVASSVRVILPNGPVPDPDPKVSRHVCAFRVSLLCVPT